MYHRDWPQGANVLNFGGGGGQQQQSATAKENEKMNGMLLRKQLAEKKEKTPNYVAPKATVFAPAPAQTSEDAFAAGEEERRNRAMRRGLMSSTIAGETGGFKAFAESAATYLKDQKANT